MLLQLCMIGIVVAGYSSFFKCSFHPFSLPACLGGYPAQSVINAMLNTYTVKRHHKIHCIFFAIYEQNTAIC